MMLWRVFGDTYETLCVSLSVSHLFFFVENNVERKAGVSFEKAVGTMTFQRSYRGSEKLLPVLDDCVPAGQPDRRTYVATYVVT